MKSKISIFVWSHLTTNNSKSENPHILKVSETNKHGGVSITM